MRHSASACGSGYRRNRDMACPFTLMSRHPSTFTLISGTTLLAVFVALKLGGAISWSWLAVLAPLWVPIVTLCGLLCCVLVGVIAACLVAVIGITIAAWVMNRLDEKHQRKVKALVEREQKDGIDQLHHHAPSR